MSSKAAEVLGHPPGVNFRPDEDELVEFFLLPRVRGEPSWFPGVVVIDDDTAANTNPTKLLERHGLAGDKDAYFFVRTADAAARQDRHCAGGGRWVSQKPVPNGACIGGQKIEWRRVNLNLQPSRGKSGGGSNGWVMHEYSLVEPPCPFLKICHVTFSGHGKDAKRVPDGDAGEPAPKRARVAAAFAASSGSSKTTNLPDQDWSATCQDYGSTAPAMDQGYFASGCQEQQLSLAQRITQCLLQPLTAQEIAEIDAGSGETDFFRELVALDAGVQRNQEPTSAAAAHASAHQQEYYSQPFPIDQGISPTSNQQFLGGTYLPAEQSAGAVYLEQVLTIEQHQPMVQETSTAECQGFSATAYHQQQKVEETAGTGEHHRGLDEEEQLFWRSIGVDTDNIAC